MSPKFRVSLFFDSKEGVLDPVANTLNRAKDQWTQEIFKDKADEISIDILSVGRSVSFCVECASLGDAYSQALQIVPEAVISNPIMERLMGIEIHQFFT